MAIDENSPPEDQIAGYELSKQVRFWHIYPTLDVALKAYVNGMIVAFKGIRQRLIDLQAGGAPPDDRNVLHAVDLMQALTVAITDLTSMLDHFTLQETLGGREAMQQFSQQANETGREEPDE